jgi:hypothetical protein
VSPRQARIAPTLQIHEVGDGECIVGYHTIRVASADDPALPESFGSHFAEGLRPRYQQTQHAAIHMAVSFWRTEDSDGTPQRRLIFRTSLRKQQRRAEAEAAREAELDEIEAEAREMAASAEHLELVRAI